MARKRGVCRISQAEIGKCRALEHDMWAKRKKHKVDTIGLVWFRREDWLSLLQMFPDRDGMQDDYDSWLADVCDLERTLKRQGHTVTRVIVTPDELAAWCALHGLTPIASARAEYVSDLQANAQNAKSRS